MQCQGRPQRSRVCERSCVCAELEAAVARPALSRWLKVVLF